jgi:membrane protein CcdC involved in cytochrome C biogenesis
MQHTGVVFIIILFIIFRIYRRIRRIGGFQKFVKWRVLVRITVMAIVGILLLFTGFPNPVMYIFDSVGILLGGIVSYIAIQTSSFEWREDNWFYSQHPRISMLLIMLFVGRIAYKAYQICASPSISQGTFGQPVLLVNYSHDPATAGTLFILITYYVVYYTFLLRTERQMKTSR